MIATKTVSYSNTLALIRGLKHQNQAGTTPRDLLFVALDKLGNVYLTLTERNRDLGSLRVGEKWTLPRTDNEGHCFMDAVHPVGGGVTVVNGDRRLAGFSCLADVASLISWFVSTAGDGSIFFGSVSPQPGCWLVSDERVEALHPRGYVDVVPTLQGLLARRTMDEGLYFLSNDALKRRALDSWRRVYSSPLGNVLLLERRLLHDQLVLSCQKGLIELDLYDLPAVTEVGRLRLEGGFGLIGRVSGAAFAVTRGRAMDWGFESLCPATLLGSPGCSFTELKEKLRDEAATCVHPNSDEF